MSTATARRRSSNPRRFRLSPLSALSVVIPLLTVGALALVQPPTEEPAVRPPSRVPLVRAEVVCPSMLPGRGTGTGTITVGNADAVDGSVEAVTSGSSSTIEVDPTGQVGTRGPVTLRGSGELAPGLVATRYGRSQSALCQRPVPTSWFVGVGAGPEHSTVLELVNPDTGPAVVDVDLLGPTGRVEAPRLRGITIPGGESVSVDLAASVPSADELTAGVSVSRGRVGVFAADTVEKLGSTASATEWLAPQGGPAERVRMLGLGTRGGERTLVVANPGDDETVVSLRLMGEESEFAPTGFDEIRVPAGSVRTVDLGDLLARKSSRGARGISLAASAPVLASVRSHVGGDLAHAVGATPVGARSAAVLPPTRKDLLLAAVDADAQVILTVRDAKGAEVDEQTFSLVAGTVLRTPVPRAGVLVDLVVTSGEAVAAVEVTDPARGRVVWPFVPLQVDALVPDVRPAHSSSR